MGDALEVRRALDRHGTRIPRWTRAEARAAIGEREGDAVAIDEARRLVESLLANAPAKRRGDMKKAFPLYERPLGNDDAG